MSPWDVDEVFTSSTLNYQLSFAATNHGSPITNHCSVLTPKTEKPPRHSRPRRLVVD